MGEKWETRHNSRQEMGVNEKRDGDKKHNFSTENKKKRKNWEKHKKKHTKKTEIYKKYRNEKRQDFGKTRFLRDKISTRFWEMLKTERRTKTRSS